MVKVVGWGFGGEERTLVGGSPRFKDAPQLGWPNPSQKRILVVEAPHLGAYPCWGGCYLCCFTHNNHVKPDISCHIFILSVSSERGSMHFTAFRHTSRDTKTLFFFLPEKTNLLWTGPHEPSSHLPYPSARSPLPRSILSSIIGHLLTIWTDVHRVFKKN